MLCPILFCSIERKALRCSYFVWTEEGNGLLFRQYVPYPSSSLLSLYLYARVLDGLFGAAEIN